MLNLIIISATVLILVAMFLYVSVKKVVKTENGRVLVTKSVFSNKYKIKPEGGVIIPGFMSGLVIDASPKTESFGIISNCINGTGTVRLDVNYTYGIDLSCEINNNLLISLPSIRSVIEDLVRSEIDHIISKLEFSQVASTHGDLSSQIPEIVSNRINELVNGISLKSMRVSFYYNYEKFNKVFEKVDPVQVADKLSDARKAADEEVEIGMIQLDKTKKLNAIEIERSKENNEKEIKLKELEIQKYSRINSKKRESDLKDEEELYKAQFKKSELEKENNLKVKELENKSNLKSIQENKSIELEKLNSELEIKSKKKELEMADIDNKLEVDKHRYEVEKQIHEEEVGRKNRELELTVDLPANAEAKKLKMLAENKAEIKMIDTKSSIESSKLKINYKKEESEILSEIKDKKDSADLKLYSKMIEIAASNPDLAIQWKKIESEVESIRIKSESISKLPLENIIINGSGTELIDSLSLISGSSSKEDTKSIKESKKK